jgi:hypothetical protein
MLELLNGVGKQAAGYYPNSGPGTKYLGWGTDEFGVFGAVSSSELFLSSELSRELEFERGASTGEITSWIKYIHQGRVCFTPLKEVRRALSWNELYDAGLIYGVDGIGKYPNEVGVSQRRLLTKNNHFFKVRLFSGSLTDPTTVLSGTYPEAHRGSEWLRLMAMVCKTPPAEYTGVRADLYTVNELTYSTIPWMQETRGDATTEALCYYLNLFQATAATKTQVGTDYSWRPVLELIDGTLVVVMHKNVVGLSSDLYEVGGFTQQLVAVTRLRNVSTATHSPLPVGHVTAHNDLTVKRVRDITNSSLLMPVSNITHSIT